MREYKEKSLRQKSQESKRSIMLRFSLHVHRFSALCKLNILHLDPFALCGSLFYSLSLFYLGRFSMWLFYSASSSTCVWHAFFFPCGSLLNLLCVRLHCLLFSAFRSRLLFPLAELWNNKNSGWYRRRCTRAFVNLILIDEGDQESIEPAKRKQSSYHHKSVTSRMQHTTRFFRRCFVCITHRLFSMLAHSSPFGSIFHCLRFAHSFF